MSEKTSVKSCGKKDGYTVELSYVHENEDSFPDIQIVGAESYPVSLVAKWNDELSTFVTEGHTFRGQRVRIDDPERAYGAMMRFYDEEPKIDVDDPEGWFDYNPDANY